MGRSIRGIVEEACKVDTWNGVLPRAVPIHWVACNIPVEAPCLFQVVDGTRDWPMPHPAPPGDKDDRRVATLLVGLAVVVGVVDAVAAEGAVETARVDLEENLRDHLQQWLMVRHSHSPQSLPTLYHHHHISINVLLWKGHTAGQFRCTNSGRRAKTPLLSSQSCIQHKIWIKNEALVLFADLFATQRLLCGRSCWWLHMQMFYGCRSITKSTENGTYLGLWPGGAFGGGT